MIVLRTEVRVAGINGEQLFAFMLHPSDAAYRRWWPGVHLAFHPCEGPSDRTGNRVYFDEYIGRWRLRARATVMASRPGAEIAWRMRKIIPLPAVVFLRFTDEPDGVRVAHELRLGFAGPGRILDPLIRLFLPRGFAAALAEHVETEFRRLSAVSDLL